MEARACLGDALPERWHRLSDPCPCGADHLALQHEVEAHGGYMRTGVAHGVHESTLVKAWQRLDLPRRPRDGGMDRRQRADERPVDDADRLREQGVSEQNKYLRRRTRELELALANRQAVVDKIVEAARVPVRVPRYRVARPAGRALAVRSAVLPVYDCQFGQLVRPEDTPLGQGKFDASVFDRRLARWLDAVTRSTRDYSATHRIEEVVVALGGDLVEGADVFRGQAWQLEYDPARQTLEFVRRWQAALGRLVAFLKEELGVRRIMVVAVPGNHGKVGGKSSGATPSTMSWDWLAVEWLRDSLRAEPIDAWGIEPGGALLFETAGHVFLTIHGDEIRGWGGLPFYGLTRYDGRAIRLSGVVHDYTLLGHHHQPASIPNGSGGEFIVSGDWVGANNLSRSLAAASRPQQRLLFVSSKYGITEHVPIYLDESDRRPPPRVYAAGAPDA